MRLDNRPFGGGAERLRGTGVLAAGYRPHGALTDLTHPRYREGNPGTPKYPQKNARRWMGIKP